MDQEVAHCKAPLLLVSYPTRACLDNTSTTREISAGHYVSALLTARADLPCLICSAWSWAAIHWPSLQ